MLLNLNLRSYLLNPFCLIAAIAVVISKYGQKFSQGSGRFDGDPAGSLIRFHIILQQRAIENLKAEIDDNKNWEDMLQDKFPKGIWDPQQLQELERIQKVTQEYIEQKTPKPPAQPAQPQPAQPAQPQPAQPAQPAQPQPV